MKNIDLLFIPHDDSQHAHICDAYLVDIALSCLSTILSNNDFSSFIKVMNTPLVDTDNILERQRIFQDLLTHPELAENMTSICLIAQQNKFPVYDRVYSSYPPKRKLADYLRVINHTLKIPSELFLLMKDMNFVSITLNQMRDQLNKGNQLSDIKLRINKLAANLLNDNVSLQIKYGSTFKFKSANIYSSGRKIVTPSKHKLFQKKQEMKGFSYGYDFIADLQVGNMLESGINKLCATISYLNSHILSYCQKLLNHLEFYIAGIKIIKHLNSIGAKTTFPKFMESCYEISTTGLYDIGLIIKQESTNDVVSNDFKGDKDTFYLISGVNQGGKTTFLKSIGMAQLFAQNGLPVAAREYICPIYNNFVTHFPCHEDENLNKGKLAEELSRFHDLLSMMTERSLILLNESFATTTEKEGAEIASDTLRALSAVKPSLFFVTHNYLLIKNQKEHQCKLKNKILFKNLIVVQNDNPSKRTYKLVQGEPQENIYTLEYLHNITF